MGYCIPRQVSRSLISWNFSLDGLDSPYLVTVSTSLMGRNCMLPWRRLEVPDFLQAVAGTVPTLDEVVFDHHCKLWFMHDQHMDKMYTTYLHPSPMQDVNYVNLHHVQILV